MRRPLSAIPSQSPLPARTGDWCAPHTQSGQGGQCSDGAQSGQEGMRGAPANTTSAVEQLRPKSARTLRNAACMRRGAARRRRARRRARGSLQTPSPLQPGKLGAPALVEALADQLGVGPVWVDAVQDLVPADADNAALHAASAAGENERRVYLPQAPATLQPGGRRRRARRRWRRPLTLTRLRDGAIPNRAGARRGRGEGRHA